ncbi:MAG: hypothetical protein RML33_11170 [Acidobacteriota bacterium]|nr:hypothetical protein [Leptospiraceae bacterium]MDW8305381.1 hypothetical protein [Acidobacteriota bacterium]
MKRVKVANPRLMLVNSAPKVQKKRNRTKNKTKQNPELKGLVVQSIAAAVGGMLVTTAASKIPLPSNPYLNILSKFGLSYGVGYVMERFNITRPYAVAVAVGGASVAASDALKIAFPALRTIFVNRQDKPVKVVTQEDPVTGEPVAVADAIGFDEFGDVITVNERLLNKGLGEVIEELDDIYEAEYIDDEDVEYVNDLVTPNWQPQQLTSQPVRAAQKRKAIRTEGVKVVS